MKVERKEEEKFIPVTITLETQEEVDVLAELVGSIDGPFEYTGRGITDRIYYGLEDYRKTAPGPTYFAGVITCIE